MRIEKTLLIVIAILLGGLAACGSSPDSDSVATEGFVTVDGDVRLYYVEKGSGPNVLVAPMAAYLAPHLLDALSESRRVILYDPRNRGRSDAADLSTISLDQQVKDLETLRAHFGLEKMGLLGWSGLGMELAVYTLRHPDRVTRLVQISPVPPAASIMRESADAPSQRQQVNQAELETLDRRGDNGEFDDTPEVYCRLRSSLADPGYFVDKANVSQLPDLCAFENEWPKNLWPYFGALLPSFGDYDWREQMKGVATPRLVIHGREDRFPLKGAEAWVAGYPEARLLVLSPSGHLPYIEQKAAVIEAVRIFLDGEWPPDAVAEPAN